MSYKDLIIGGLSWLPLKNYILLESVPDLSDNTKAVFDEMIKRKINDNYKIVWLVRGDQKSYPKIYNVKYIFKTEKWKIRFYLFFSKALICCNGFLIPYRKKQMSIYLMHGLPIKSVRNYYTVPEKIQYVLSPSKYVNEIISKEFNVNINKVVSLGYPRNDVFINKKAKIKTVFSNQFDKIIVWYPTFRQKKNGLKHGGENSLPIIYDSNNAIMINNFAKKNNTLIVLKPHFAQDVSYINDLKLSNIKIISDQFFYDNAFSSYEFINSCDALITDYSSVYYDYTLCNKPIAVIWEDIEEYKTSPGIAVDLDVYLKGAKKIYSANDFCNFIDNVAHNIDIFRKEREAVKELVTFTDGKSSERVVDFIINKINN